MQSEKKWSHHVNMTNHHSQHSFFLYLVPRKCLNNIIWFSVCHSTFRLTPASPVALRRLLKWYYSIKLMFTNWNIYSYTYQSHQHNVSNNFSKHTNIFLACFFSLFIWCCRQSITYLFACVYVCNGIYRTYGALAGYIRLKMPVVNKTAF